MLSFAVRQSRPLVTLIVSLCLLAPLRAQEATAPPPEEDEVVRVSAELVQTDVMVFDKQGKFVDGLRPEQFELKVDGRAVPVAFFERVEAGTVDEDAQLAAARGGGARSNTRPAGSPVPLDRGRTVIFFVDDLHLSPSSAARTRQALVRFIDEELGQNDEAAVASASGQIGFLQQFTDNRAVLRAAAARLKGQPYNLSDGQSPPMSEVHALAVARRDPSVTGYFISALLREIPNLTRETAENMVTTRAQIIARQSQQVTDQTLYALQSLVRHSAPLPGHKLLFFISDGFHLDTQDGSSRDRLRRITDAAARAGVVIYSMDAAGLRPGTSDASSQVAFDSGGRLASADSGALRDLQEPLHTLAADTGGRALVNTNAMGPAVEGALRETARYYLLAWRPGGEGGGRGASKFRRIEVNVPGRKDLNVIVRRGFYGGAPPEEERRGDEAKRRKRDAEKPGGRDKQAPASPESAAEQELRAALGSARPRAALPTSVSLGFVNTKEQGTLLTASVGLDREALGLFPPGERARVDLLGVIYDERGQFVTGFRHGLAFEPREAAERLQERVMHSYQLKLEPGLFQVRVAARDRRSGRTGSASEWIEVPSFKEPRFALSSIFLAERAGGETPAELTAENVTSGVLFNVNRRFARTSRMRFLAFVYHASGARPDVALQVQIFRDDQPVFTAPLAKVSPESSLDAARLPYAAELPLETFPPGRYALQLTAIDRQAKTTATQRVNFAIEESSQ